jgi:hypothetical protein
MAPLPLAPCAVNRKKKQKIKEKPNNVGYSI